jgi:galactose mutarotase-like enzyme
VADRRPGDSLEAHLDWSSRALLELFPYRHEVRLELRIADGKLAIATTVRATSDDAVPVSFGYHPYLRIPGSPREIWDVKLGATRRLVLDQRSIPTGEREPVIERRMKLGHTSWDAGFDGLSLPPRFSAAGGEAELTVTFQTGYDFAQVFAPDGQEFICFEPMTATSNALNSGDGLLILAPGGEHRAEFTVAITSGLHPSDRPASD